MRVLITGGAGFIGSHLADALLARGDSVILLDNLSTGRLENIEHLRQRDDVEFVLGSILNADLVDDVMSRSDICFHLAAAVGVELIVDKPLESLATNIRGSEIVFEKAHKHGTKVLVTSTRVPCLCAFSKTISDPRMFVARLSSGRSTIRCTPTAAAKW